MFVRIVTTKGVVTYVRADRVIQIEEQEEIRGTKLREDKQVHLHKTILILQQILTPQGMVNISIDVQNSGGAVALAISEAIRTNSVQVAELPSTVV